MRVEPRTDKYPEAELSEFPDCTKIASHTITVIPRYSETDQAGVVHHTVYPVWFEMGRTELLRVNGLAYSELEKKGIYFVVSELSVKYRRPAFYDEKLDQDHQCPGGAFLSAVARKNGYSAGRGKQYSGLCGG